MNLRRLTFALCSLLAIQNATFADVKLSAIFTPHLVLQRDQANPVWGTAAPGEEVTVTIAGQSKKATAGADGNWKVKLDPLPVNATPQMLTIAGKNTIVLDDVLVGEVWICSGQSNMQWEVQQSVDADLEARTAKFPKIRFISVPQVGTQAPQETFSGKWEVCTPETAPKFSAVGYFFGRQLHETLEVPIGLIDNAWGGSACEAWIRRDILQKDERYKPLLDRWTAREANLEKDMEKYKSETFPKWKEAADKAKAEGKPIPRQPNSPEADMRGNSRPANIYNGVLKPTIGYGIRGAIWYQGESNAGRAYQYRHLFPLMIQSWRDEWAQGDFPFYWVQLADYRDEKPEPAESDWAELREAQTMTMTKLPNTGEAVIIDKGEANDIHPRNKQDVAKRLSRWALSQVYGDKTLAYRSPIYKAMEVKDGKVIVTFDHVGTGLRTLDVSKVIGFSIAGEDKKFVWADAKIIAPNQVEVSSKSVAAPVSVRYAWADNPVCNVISREGLPLTPFRTDDWPGITANAN